MKRNFPPLEMMGPATLTVDEATLAKTRFAGNFQLPKSYRNFANRFGYGRLGGLLLIYVPMGKKGDSLAIRFKELRGMLEMSMEEDLFEFEPDGSPELVQRLVPFGISENGHTLAWDPEEPTAADENAIYVVGAKALAVYKAAPNLYDFVEKLLNNDVKKVLGPGYKRLPATFQPLKPA
jgi:hypothetical protein